MTFFDWPQTPPDRRGTDSIATTMFRVNGRAALDFWAARFDALGVKHEAVQTFAGRALLRFEDPEGQRLALVDDEGADFEGVLPEYPDVPTDFAIRGFYGVILSIPQIGQIEPILVQVLGFTETAQHSNPDNAKETVYVYGMDGGGAGREVWVIEQPRAPLARTGSGGVHHVAYRVRDEAEQRAWNEQLNRVGLRTSGIIDRYYFKSLYFRISNGILFELATDGPGFAADEDLETLGERLALPPFLEPQRERIEAGLKPL
jgi:glyoxalase family protein